MDASGFQVLIETDEEVYLISDDNYVHLQYAYINLSALPVYLGTCYAGPSYTLEKKLEGVWVVAYSGFCPDMSRTPIVIAPGETYQIDYALPAWTQNVGNWRVNAVEGTYRVREELFLEWNRKKYERGTLESGTWYSNEFEIRRAD